MVTRTEQRRHVARLVLAGLISAAALATPACGGDSAGAPPPAEPGGNVDPGATKGVGGIINKAKGTADAQEQHDRDLGTAVP